MASAKTLNAALKQTAADGDKLDCESATADLRYDKESSYELTARRPGAFVVRYAFYQYTGGAHGMSYSRCFSADSSTRGRSPRSRRSCSRRPPARRSRAPPSRRSRRFYGENEMEWTPGTVTISDATSLCVDGADLVVKFQPYEAGPYALGAPRVTIPRTDVTSVVAGTPLEPFFR